MASVNKVTLVGHLGHDPSISFLAGGTKVAKFSVATSESWKDKTSGEWKSITEWHTVKILNERLAELAEKSLTKGSKVYVEGKIQSNKWTGKDGHERTAFEIVLTSYKGELVLLDSKKEGSTSQHEINVHDPKYNTDTTRTKFGQPEQQPANYDPTHYKDLEDEIPF